MSKTFRKDLTGQRFGRLVVVEFVPDKTKKARWLCKCDCGNKKNILQSNLIYGHSKSCGCEKTNDLTGKTFGYLFVDSLAYKERNRIYYHCICKCGNKKIIRSDGLISGFVVSCGCYRNENTGNLNRKDFGESAFNGLYRSYKNQAKIRNICFDLDKDIFIKLTKQNCIYCNMQPNNIFKNKTTYGHYVYNGIDRIDSSKGYTEDNVAPCCGTCNTMKMALGQEEFLDHIKRIYEHQKLGETA